MKNNKGFAPVLIALIVAGALIIGGGAYWLGKNKGENKKVVENLKVDNQVEENQNKDMYPKVFEYGNKENQLYIALSELGDDPAPEILNVNENGSILFHDKGYGLKIFSKKDGKLNYTTENIPPFRYASIDNKENIYVLNDLTNPDIFPIVKYDKKGNMLGFLNNNNLRSLIQPNSGPLFDKLYISNNDLYLYGSGSENSYKITSLDNFKGLDNLQKVSGKYGISGDLFYSRVDSKKGYDYLKITQSDGKEREFSFENKRTAGFFFLNEDKNGNAYVQSDSCDLGYTISNCTSTVYKINKTSGNIVGIKELPKSYYLSYNDIVVDNDGNIYYLNLQKDKAYLEKYFINEPAGISNSEESKKSEKQIGYIKSIYSKDNTNYLTIDYVQWTHCDTDDCVASIKVINDNPLIRTFPISKNVQVKLVTYPDASGNYSLNQNLSLSKFKEALDYSLNNTFNPNHPPEVYYHKTILYWITIENGIITEIAEQFQA